MGAQEFQDASVATDVAEAFRECVEQAQYDYGHAGYTGTVAEKDEYVVLDLPANVPVELAVQALRESWRSERQAEKRPSWLPQRVIDAYHDKWGPAVAIRDGEGWRFVGWASS